jgi:hypothetical protein
MTAPSRFRTDFICSLPKTLPAFWRVSFAQTSLTGHQKEDLCAEKVD